MPPANSSPLTPSWQWHVIGKLPHKVFFPGRDVVSFMTVQEQSGEWSLTFIGLFGIYVAEGSWQSGGLHRYGERQPNRHIPAPEHTQPLQGRAEGNTLTSRSQEEERRAKFYDEVNERYTSAWGKRGGIPLPPRGNLEEVRLWREEIEDVRREVLQPLTPEERSQYDLEHLKRLPLMSGRITYAESGIKPGSLRRLQQLDPEFMEPIIKGLAKRPAREEKKSRATGRILQRIANDQRQREQ